MGSVFSTKSSTPPPPPSPPPATYRDEIGGTEQVPVKNEDGTVTYITRKLPLTEEEQAREDEYNQIMEEALAEIKKLSASDYNGDEATQEVLDAWEDERQEYVDDAYDYREEQEEKLLARRGLSSSSAGDAARRRRLMDKQNAEASIEREKSLLSTDIRNEKLALQQNLYNIASNRQDIENARTLSSATSGLSSLSSINASNRASVADYYNRQMNAYNSQLQSSPSMFGGSFDSESTTDMLKLFAL